MPSRRTLAPTLRGPLLPAVLLALLACAAPPVVRAPLRAPDLAREVRCYQGTPLSGPLLGEPAASTSAAAPVGSAGAALRVVVRCVALERMPELLLDPLAGQRRLIAAVGSGSALRASSLLVPGARAGQLVSADSLEQVLLAGAHGPALSCGELSAALPAGVTASLSLARELSLRGQLPSREAVTILVGRSQDGRDLDVGLLVEDGRTIEGDPRLELNLLRPFPGAAPGTGLHEPQRLDLGLVLPSPFGFGAPGSPRGLVLLLSITPAPRPGWPEFAGHARAFAACLGDLARDRVVARHLSAVPPSAAPPAPTRAPPPPEALRREEVRRPALLHLASAEGAALCADVALGGSDRLVADVCSRVLTALSSSVLERDGPPPGLGWTLERSAGESLLAACFGEDELALSEAEAPPAALELLRRHTGGLALLPGSLQQALEVEDLAAWRARLAAENRDLLDEGWPTLRLRAWEWLNARGLAPPGYDPLGPPEAREAALEAALAAGRGQPTAGAEPGAGSRAP